MARTTPPVSRLDADLQAQPLESPRGASDAWAALRACTSARIALGRAGGSLPTAPLLEFQRAHARARDAVHAPLDADAIEQALRRDEHDVLLVRSQAAAQRTTYLQRPDLGRRLDEACRDRLLKRAQGPCDVAFVIADGLSALAVARHALGVLAPVVRTLAGWGWRIAPMVIATGARVALADEIGECLQAQQVAILIGERPGLSAADSLGIYLTYAPHAGRTDAERNCISNIHTHGLSYEQAAHKLVYLMREARNLKLTGVGLKDESDRLPIGSNLA